MFQAVPLGRPASWNWSEWGHFLSRGFSGMTGSLRPHIQSWTCRNSFIAIVSIVVALSKWMQPQSHRNRLIIRGSLGITSRESALGRRCACFTMGQLLSTKHESLDQSKFESIWGKT